MAVTLRFHDQKFVEGFERATATGLIRASVFYHNEARRAVSRPNSRNRKTGEYDNPSLPGEPPKARTGFGRQNIVREFNGDYKRPAVRVGIRRNAMYMFWLEVGIRTRPITIRSRTGKKLMIPWRGPPPTPQQIKDIGLKKIRNKWYYFRQEVRIPAGRIAARPWLIPTLMRLRTQLGLLAMTETKRAMPK